MSSWPDDGALVMRWKKANEARRTKLSLMILLPESLKECWVFFNLCFSLFERIVEIRRIADMHIDTIVASVLFKTQLLHDTRHFVRSSLALAYSVKVTVSFSILPFFFFLKCL